MSSRNASNVFDEVGMRIVIILVIIVSVSNTYFKNWIALYVWVAVSILLILALILWQKRKTRRIEIILEQIRQRGLEQEIINFIERFSKEVTKTKRTEAWRPREGYAFDWKRLEDFRDGLIEKGMHFSRKDFSEDKELDETFERVLKHFIDEKERDFLQSRVSAKTAHAFGDLDTRGVDFEHLIVRLSEAMGYSANRIGGTGDQGGDVIACRGQEQVLIQAKCYTYPVGNKAVQEAAAAREFHHCNKAVVMTTSTFTPEAKALAQATGVELVDRRKLQEYLTQYLHESWQ